MARDNVTQLEVIETRHRQPPANEEAEQALLGAILAANHTYDTVAHFLKPQHFFLSVHGEIYEACGKLIMQGRTANAVALKNVFDEVEALAEVGGSQYLAGLQANYVSLLNVADYGRTIHDLFLRRQMIELGETLARDGYACDLETTAAQQLDKADAALLKIRERGAAGDGLRPASELGRPALEEVEAARRAHAEGRTVGLSTGLYDLDRMLAGLHKGDLIILAGRPSMGKTALGAGIAHCAAVNGEPAFFFSREMTASQLMARWFALRSRIDFDRIRKGDLSDDEFDRICAEQAALAKLPLFIDDDRGANTVQSIRAAARRRQRRDGLSLVVVDYLQLLQAAERTYRDNRVAEVTAISRELKLMAGELDVPVIALSQLSRASEGRDDKRPQLQDLRESGAIEQDADVVVFVHRPEYYLQRDEPKDRKSGETEEKFDARRKDWQYRIMKVGGKAEIIVGKQRQGALGVVNCDWDSRTLRYSDEGQGSLI